MMRISIVLDCTDEAKLSAFWRGALGYEQVAADGAFIGLKDPDDRLPTFVLQRVPERKLVKNRMHIDVFSDDFDRHLARLKDLGGTVVTPERTEPDGMRVVVLADPEGNEFCLLDPAGT